MFHYTEEKTSGEISNTLTIRSEAAAVHAFTGSAPKNICSFRRSRTALSHETPAMGGVKQRVDELHWTEASHNRAKISIHIS
jgi:hypothetical protein